MAEILKEVFKYSKEVFFALEQDRETFKNLIEQLDTSHSVEKNYGVLNKIKDFLGKTLLNVASTGLHQVLLSVL